MNDSTLFSPDIEAKVNEVESEFANRATEVLASVLNRDVSVTLKDISPFDFKTLKADYPKNTVFITIPFQEGFEGNILYLLDPKDAAFLAGMMMTGEGEQEFEPNEHLDPVQELLNQVMADYGKTLSSIFDEPVSFRKCKAVLIDLSPADFQDSNWIRVQFEINVGQKIDLCRLVSWSAIHKYVPETEDDVETMLTAPEEPEPVIPEMATEEDDSELQLLMDIELPITIELGRTQMMIKNILKLSPGSIVELDKLSGEPVDLYVNNKKFAEGEVVVVDENFGVRLTEIVQVDERIRNLEG
jgi:flagellar motor switch protein FliN/FliY